MNEYFKRDSEGGGTQNGSSVLSTRQSVMVPQAQLGYLIKAKLHHSAGKGSRVQERSCVCIYMCFQERERASERRLREGADRQKECEMENRVTGCERKRAKQNVWAVSKTGSVV